MIVEAAANPTPVGSDSVQPSTALDDAENYADFDPSEDNEDDDQDQQSESEPDEADSQETDETPSEEDDTAEAEEEGAEDKAANPEPKDDVTVTVNGEQLALSELKSGYMKEKDYRNKTQELGNKRRDLDALSARVTSSVNAIAEFLSKQIPESPDPSLAMTNPGEFVQKKALHEAAMAQVNVILSQAGQVKEVVDTLTAEQRAELLQSENAKLSEAFPQVATPEGRKQFFETAASAAADLGWSRDEIGKVTDHRMFKLAHYAALGLAAEKAKAKAKQKVENKPPVAPQKRLGDGNSANSAKSKEAMKRLRQTGSIHDAMRIDFD